MPRRPEVRRGLYCFGDGQAICQPEDGPSFDAAQLYRIIIDDQPPGIVKRLTRWLHEEHRLLGYVLVDNSRWRYYIYSVIKQGSINLAFES